MNTPNSAENPGQQARVLLKTLQQSFSVFRDYSPLAIGIDKQVLARLDPLDRKTLRIALGMHTHSLRYLKVMEKATHRLDLDGNPAEEVTDTHRSYAAELLRERFKKDAERRRAQREAEAAEREAATLERKRAEKLSQLMEKFGKAK
jgi:ProP effector